MEGVASEAASLAGHLQLGKLIYLYDDNHISIEGSTDMAFTEDRGSALRPTAGRCSAWRMARMWKRSIAAIQAAKTDPRPSLIMVRNIIGYGLPTRPGTAKAHGEPPGDEELDGAKDKLGWPKEPRFYHPGRRRWPSSARRWNSGAKLEAEWQKKLAGLPGRIPRAGRRTGAPPGRQAAGRLG